MGPNKARKRLASIRCVLDTVHAIKENKALPEALCFVPESIEYVILPDLYTGASKSTKPVCFNIYSSPEKNNGRLIGRVAVQENMLEQFSLMAYGEEYSNSGGDWIQITKDGMKSFSDVIFDANESQAWVLLHQRDLKAENVPKLVPKYEITDVKPTISKDDMFGGFSQKSLDLRRGKSVYRWQNLVETNYMLHLLPPSLPSNADTAAIARLSEPPANWSWEADEELVRFIVGHSKSHDMYTGGASEYIESVQVSSEQDSAAYLLDNDPETYWESDGSIGRHYIRLQIKPEVVIQKLIIGVNQSDDNYVPSRVLVYAIMGSAASKLLNEVRVDSCQNGDVVVLEDACDHYSQIEIRIKECKDDGIDCRIHYVKMMSSKQKQCGLNKDLFANDLVRYPKLESIGGKNRYSVLYRRAIALTRFISLFDNVILYLLPAWDYTGGTYTCLEEIRQLLPLSKRRPGLIENCLRESQSTSPANMPKIYLNRHLAAQHLVNPTLDPEAKDSLFNQLYQALRADMCEVNLDYRWPQKYDQWWECKFIGEGIIDQGGGFRDSLSDLAEELCPSSLDFFVPVPFMVRSPNQTATSNMYRDCYIPNQLCRQFLQYEWIGKIMGACLRSNESLVLSLPPFVWKKFNGERISFQDDYYTVDAAQVKFHETLRCMSEEDFEAGYANMLTYTTVLANGEMVVLKEDGGNEFVKYEDRFLFMEMVEGTRMMEFDEQVSAMRAGLEMVVPRAVLTLMTWQEIEKRVCGDPEISVEALKKSAHYEDYDDEMDDISVRYLWKALENFTNEDRSRFLRFVTGRRRLPTPLYICRSKGQMTMDPLPESATCSHTVFLPCYSSASKAEEKLRYAIYNCIAIDADMSPWED